MNKKSKCFYKIATIVLLLLIVAMFVAVGWEKEHWMNLRSGKEKVVIFVWGIPVHNAELDTKFSNDVFKYHLDNNNVSTWVLDRSKTIFDRHSPHYKHHGVLHGTAMTHELITFFPFDDETKKCLLLKTLHWATDCETPPPWIIIESYMSRNHLNLFNEQHMKELKEFIFECKLSSFDEVKKSEANKGAIDGQE